MFRRKHDKTSADADADSARSGGAATATAKATDSKNSRSKEYTDDSTRAVDRAILLSRGPAAPKVAAFRIGLVGGLGVLVSLVIGGIIGQLSTVLVYIGVALFLALGLDPLVTWLSKKMPRGLAIGAVMLAVVAAFAGLMFTIIPIIVEQTSKLIDDFPKITEDIANSDFVATLEQQLAGYVDFDAALNSIKETVSDPNLLFNVGGGILAVGAGVAGGFTGAVIVLILMLYFLASLHAMKQTAYRFVPAYRRQAFADVSEEITGAVGRYVVGQVSLAGINGILTFILMTVIGGPLPVLLACIAFIASLIPLIGTLSGAVIISLICLFASPVTALVAAIYYVIYMQVEAYVLSPRIMNRAVAVPGALVVIAAVAGGAVGGVLGALVAIPIAASAIIIIQKVVFPTQDSKKTSPDTADVTLK